jgi:recombination protein RecA
MQSYIRYGIGIDESAELCNLCVNLGLIKKAGAWYNVVGNEEKFQGLEKLIIGLDSNPTIFEKLKNDVKGMLVG